MSLHVTIEGTTGDRVFIVNCCTEIEVEMNKAEVL